MQNIWLGAASFFRNVTIQTHCWCSKKHGVDWPPQSPDLKTIEAARDPSRNLKNWTLKQLQERLALESSGWQQEERQLSSSGFCFCSFKIFVHFFNLNQLPRVQRASFTTVWNLSKLEMNTWDVEIIMWNIFTRELLKTLLISHFHFCLFWVFHSVLNASVWDGLESRSSRTNAAEAKCERETRKGH